MRVMRIHDVMMYHACSSHEMYEYNCMQLNLLLVYIRFVGRSPRARPHKKGTQFTESDEISWDYDV